jgi:acyl-CoA hydrolase
MFSVSASSSEVNQLGRTSLGMQVSARLFSPPKSRRHNALPALLQMTLESADGSRSAGAFLPFPQRFVFSLLLNLN